MPSAWRQGDLVAPEHAVALGLVTPEERDSYRFVVASHSCDIAKDSDDEPQVEFVRATVVPAQQHPHSNGHHIQILHLTANGIDGSEWLELQITDRWHANKADFLAATPWRLRTITAEQRNILRRWLAQRYSRSAFPDALNEWLKESHIKDKFEQFGKRYSKALIGIYIDLDDDTEHEDPAEPYELGIYLVYSTSDAENAATAEDAAQKLEALFVQKCQRDGRWHWFQLVECIAVADTVFSLRAAVSFRRWRFEHRSVDGEPVDDET